MVEPAVRFHVAQLQGHLTVESLRLSLSGLDRARPLLVDATAMTGYDVAARELFVERLRALRPRTAIVHENPIWQLVIATMSLAVGFPISSFSRRTDAERWLVTAKD